MRKLCTSKLHQGPRWLLWTEFSVKQWADIERTVPLKLQSRCRTCERIRLRNVRGFKPRKYSSTLTRKKQKQQRYLKIMSKPDTRSELRQKNREYALDKQRANGILPRNYTKPTRQRRVLVDPYPLMDWLGQRYSNLSDNQQRRLREAQEMDTIELGAVDRILFELEAEHMLAILYPLSDSDTP